MKISAVLIAVAVGFAVAAAAALADGSIGPVYYANGDSALATDGCGPGDLCATITLSGGDTIKVLTGGSGHCNPYVMTFMRYHAGALDRTWSSLTDRNPDSSSAFGGMKCGSFHNTRMPIDGGVVDMGIFQKTDGSVFVQFFGGSTTAPATPGPSPVPVKT